MAPGALISTPPATPTLSSDWDEGYFTATTPGTDTEDDVLKVQTITPAIVRTDTEPLVAIIGVGFVGLELVLSFASAYKVIGFDISKERIHNLRKQYTVKGSIGFTDNAAQLSAATHFLISVPTLLNPDKSIDSSALQGALAIVSKYARPGSTVVVESSVAVGMTRQLLGPIAASKGFFAGMSPERVDPGRTEPPVKRIPKVISGLDDVKPGSLDTIVRLYSAVFDNVVPVSQPEVAEMVKLYENCQRMMCIAYANEMADACAGFNIDPYEVCAAASTKPFGYMPFAPGLGVGGHCIPINPYYLLSNCSFPLLQQAAQSMNNRPSVIADKLLASLGVKSDRNEDKHTQMPRVLVVGVGFKRGQSHLSNSPGLQLARKLKESELVKVMFADTLVSQSAIPDIERLPDKQWNAETLDKFDIIVIAFKQVDMDFNELNYLRKARVEEYCP